MKKFPRGLAIVTRSGAMIKTNCSKTFSTREASAIGCGSLRALLRATEHSLCKRESKSRESENERKAEEPMRKIERIDAREITMEGLEAFGFARVG